MRRLARNIPHSTLIASHHSEMLDELKTTLDAFLVAARSDGEQRSIYKLCTAGYSVLRAFSLPRELRLLSAAAGGARRCAVLATIRQISLARVELRRLIECAVWYAYFVDHPVEFEAFEANPSRDWTSDKERPIESIARAEIGFFFRYALERARAARSTRVPEAVNTLKTAYGEMSGEVHAALGALGASATLSQAHDPYDAKLSAHFREDVDRVLTAAVLVISAVNTRLLAHLTAMERGWADWLIGVDASKEFRADSIGILRTD
jgi:hypothetical protein